MTKIIIAGGGAAGFFAAITCKQNYPDAEVLIIEKGPNLLSKVALSGGGRCNLSNAVFNPDLAINYPRGNRELIGAFYRFGPQETIDWFQSNGVELKTEPDNRIFPLSNRSQTIVDCLISSAENAGVKVRKNTGLQSASRLPDSTQFELLLTDGSKDVCDRLILTTGGTPQSEGISVAQSFGHTIIEQIPSLFTFVYRTEE